MLGTKFVMSTVLIGLTAVIGLVVGSRTNEERAKPAAKAAAVAPVQSAEQRQVPEATRKSGKRSPTMPMCPMCPMRSDQTPGPEMCAKMMEKCQAMMKQMGGPGKTMQMCPMMKQMEQEGRPGQMMQMCPMMKQTQPSQPGSTLKHPPQKPAPAQKNQSEGSGTKQ